MRKPLIVEAIKKANKVRKILGFDMFEPINIYDACINLGLTVRFVDVNMEGMYISQEDKNKSNILISCQRPFPRRYFTCAHELGHHIFGHGTKLDTLNDETNKLSSYNDEELLVDAFAGALLMPILGIQTEFIKRKWTIETATPLQIYTICSVFGVGYSTLITHCKANKLINEEKATGLLKQTPAKILKSLLGDISEKSYFKIIDEHYSQPLIDIEVSNYIFIPENIIVEGNHLEKCNESNLGIVYIAKHPGIIRISTLSNSISYFVRIQNAGYVGLAENRHLEKNNE